MICCCYSFAWFCHCPKKRACVQHAASCCCWCSELLGNADRLGSFNLQCGDKEKKFMLFLTARLSKAVLGIALSSGSNCSSDFLKFYSISSCFDILRHIQTCLAMFKHVQTCSNMFQEHYLHQELNEFLLNKSLEVFCIKSLRSILELSWTQCF